VLVFCAKERPISRTPGVHSQSYLDLSLRAFLEALAGPSPEPAGGAACAVACAAAAALVSLACGVNATAQASGPTDPARMVPASAEALRRRAESLTDEDVAAYADVMSAAALPVSTPVEQEHRRTALDRGLERAATVPLSVADIAIDVLELGLRCVPSVSPRLFGDLAVAESLAAAAARGALATARVNALAMSDATGGARIEVAASVRDGQLSDLAGRWSAALARRGQLRDLAIDAESASSPSAYSDSGTPSAATPNADSARRVEPAAE
jgi:formiminotetrahydrofolate cyclodeaminase